MSDGGLPIERSVLIRNKRGLHARAAAKLVTTAERFDAEVEVRGDATPDDPGVSAKSIMGLMMLGAGLGSTLTLSARGPQAAAALDAAAALIEAGFEEQE